MIIDVVARVGFITSGLLMLLFQNPYLFFFVAAFGLVALLRGYYRWFVQMNEIQPKERSENTHDGVEKAGTPKRPLEHLKSENSARVVGRSDSGINASGKSTSVRKTNLNWFLIVTWCLLLLAPLMVFWSDDERMIIPVVLIASLMIVRALHQLWRKKARDGIDTQK